MKTFVPQNPANAGAIATTIDFAPRRRRSSGLFHPGSTPFVSNPSACHRA